MTVIAAVDCVSFILIKDFIAIIELKRVLSFAMYIHLILNIADI